jgi:DNA-binding Lrp family transcriptional regulator
VDNLLTKNEKKVLRLLMGYFGTEHSINQIAKECGLAPNGALKILKKLENEGILKSEKIANIKSYKINFGNEKTANILELALMSEPEGRIKYRAADFSELKNVTKCCIIFGSYVDSKKDPHDLDVLFVLETSSYKEFSRRLSSVKQTTPVKIHDVVQTEEDLRRNIKKKDKVVQDIIRKGIVLWGHKMLVRVLEDAYKG